MHEAAEAAHAGRLRIAVLVPVLLLWWLLLLVLAARVPPHAPLRAWFPRESSRLRFRSRARQVQPQILIAQSLITAQSSISVCRRQKTRSGNLALAAPGCHPFS